MRANKINTKNLKKVRLDEEKHHFFIKLSRLFFHYCIIKIQIASKRTT